MSIFSSIKSKISSALGSKPKTSVPKLNIPNGPMSTSKGPKIPNAPMSTNKGPRIPDAPSMSQTTKKTDTSKVLPKFEGPKPPAGLNPQPQSMGVSAKKVSSGGGGSSKKSTPTLPANQIDYAAQKTAQDATYGKQTQTGQVGGVDYTITGNQTVDEINKAKAREIAQRNKDAEREARIKEQNTGYSNAGLIQQLIDLQRKTQQDIAPKVGNLAMMKSRNAQQIANTLGSAGDEALQTGRAGIYQQLAAQQEAVRQAEIDNILQGATTSAGMLGTGISATAPVLQFGQLTTPQTGQVVGAGESGNNPALDQAVQRAVLIAQSGGGDAAARNTLTGFGQAGLNAYIQAMQGGGAYNPTMLDAQATAQAGLGTAGTQANASSLRGITEQINTIQATAPAAQAGMDNLVRISEQMGIRSTNLPILNELVQKVNDQVISVSAMSAFKSQLEQTINQYNQIPGVQTVIADQVSLDQLRQIKNTLNTTVNNTLTALNNKRMKLESSGVSSGSVNPYQSSGSTGGGLYNW